MTTSYVVMEQSKDTPAGVFTTREKAEAFVNAYDEQGTGYLFITDVENDYESNRIACGHIRYYGWINSEGYTVRPEHKRVYQERRLGLNGSKTSISGLFFAKDRDSAIDVLQKMYERYKSYGKIKEEQ